MIPSRSELEGAGRFWMRHALGEGDLARLERACGTGGAPGRRLDWNDDLLDAVGPAGRLTQLADALLPGAFAVRIVAFNKSRAANWQVPWHQDRVIAVRDKHAIGGFTAWTRKAGTWHVEPPIDLLQGMIFARVHLDDTDTGNGCLELALGTHMQGWVAAHRAADVARSAPLEQCHGRRGDVLFVKALTLHRSAPSQRQASRRTLRIDYCAKPLPRPLEWAMQGRAP